MSSTDYFLSRPCPRCRAQTGEPCVGRKGVRKANHAARRAAAPRPGVGRANTPGLVYFIGCAKAGAVKIGFTRGNPEARRADLQTGAPGPLVVLAATPGTLADERALHSRFEAYHLHGEWFTLKGWLLAHVEELRTA